MTQGPDNAPNVVLAVQPSAFAERHEDESEHLPWCEGSGHVWGL